MKKQVRPVCSPKDKLWSRTDKLQRCRRLPLEQAELKQIVENKSKGVLIRKWFDRCCVAEFLCDLLYTTLGIPVTNIFRTKCNNFHNIQHDGSVLVCLALTCLQMVDSKFFAHKSGINIRQQIITFIFACCWRTRKKKRKTYGQNSSWLHVLISLVLRFCRGFTAAKSGLEGKLCSAHSMAWCFVHGFCSQVRL